MTEVTIASVGPDRGPEIRHLMDLAFNDPRPFDPDEPQFEQGRVVGAFDGDDLVGTVMTHPFTQIFGGRPVACGGVAGVAVAPHARRRGLSGRMLAETLARMSDRGEVISSLYPTTSLVYAAANYGIGGEFARRRVPFRALGPSDPLDWEPCAFGCPEMRAVQQHQAERHDGWIIPSGGWWDYQAWRRSAPPSDRAFSYIGRRKGDPVAAVVYTYGPSEHLLYDLRAQLLAGVDTPALRSALTFLASNGSTADELETTLPSHMLDVVVRQPELVRAADDWPWMLRIVDLPGAISARGFAHAVDLAVDLDVTDNGIEANQQRWRLSISDGAGVVEPGGDGTVQVGIRELARIYAGADPRLLHDDGALAGITPGDLGLVAAAFATRATLPIFF